MLFWEILFSILMVLSLPYKVKKIKYENHTLFIVHVLIMPWSTGVTIGRLVFTTYSQKSLEKNTPFIHHEFQHHKQWLRFGWKFLPLYIWFSIKALFKGKRPYYDNKFEIEAYKAEYKFRDKHDFGYIDRYLNEE